MAAPTSETIRSESGFRTLETVLDACCRSSKARRFVREAWHRYPQPDMRLPSIITAIDRYQMALLNTLANPATDEDDRADLINDLKFLMAIKSDIGKRVLVFLDDPGLSPAAHMAARGEDRAHLASALAPDPGHLSSVLPDAELKAAPPVPEELLPPTQPSPSGGGALSWLQ